MTVLAGLASMAKLSVVIVMGALTGCPIAPAEAMETPGLPAVPVPVTEMAPPLDAMREFVPVTKTPLLLFGPLRGEPPTPVTVTVPPPPALIWPPPVTCTPQLLPPDPFPPVPDTTTAPPLDVMREFVLLTCTP